jgi:hypothetical protein
MATATSSRNGRRGRWAIRSAAAAALALLAALAIGAVNQSPPANQGAFAWLHPAAAPNSWNVAVTPAGARFAYPPGWQPIRTDPGTASAAPHGPRGAFRGYLNATPQSGTETLANWRRFRVEHVADEGAHDVRLGDAAENLHFRSGHGSCVTDGYSTDRERFREIACIVAGPHSTTVIVAAAPANRWHQAAPQLERAVASFEP